MKLILKSSISILLFLWMAYSLYHQIQRQQNLRATIHDLYAEWDVNKIVLISLVVVLMLANWTVEALKWRLLLKDTEKISVVKSLESVLTGVAVSVVTPNRIGEYMGRILFLRNIHKLQGITVTIIGSFAQLLVTGLFGLLGLLYYVMNVKHNAWLNVLLISSVVLCVVLGYLYFHLYKIVDWTQKIAPLKRLKVYIEIVKRFSRSHLYRILLLSVLRYSIYTLQFFLLLRLMQVYAPAHDTVFTIWLIFWAMAIVPTIAIAEIGIRGETALLFLLPLSSNQLGIVSSSLLLWLINLIIPALIGCLFVYQMKIYEDE